MGTWNSRTVNPSSFYQSFGAPFSDLSGEDIASGENRYHNITLPTDALADIPLPIGTKVRSVDGKIWCYVQAMADIGIGHCVVNDTLDAVAAPIVSSADLLIITDADAAWTAGAYAGDYVYIDAGTGKTQTRRIVANDTTNLFLDRPLTTALSTDSTMDILRPYRVINSTTTTTHVAGVGSAVSATKGVTPGTYAIDSGYYGWIQVGGWCDQVEYNAALTIEAPLTNGTTAGRVIAMTDGTEEFVFGACKGVVAAAGDLGPAMLYNCTLGV
jgi:hypothetical protein